MFPEVQKCFVSKWQTRNLGSRNKKLQTATWSILIVVERLKAKLEFLDHSRWSTTIQTHNWYWWKLFLVLRSSKLPYQESQILDTNYQVLFQVDWNLWFVSLLLVQMVNYAVKKYLGRKSIMIKTVYIISDGSWSSH